MRTTLILAVLSLAPATLAAQVTPPRQTDADAYTRYELLAPGSGKFRIIYDITAVRPGLRPSSTRSARAPSPRTRA